MRFDRILFPTDFSDHSLAVKPQVEALARRFGSKVTLMHVFEIPTSWCMGGEASFMSVECLSDLISSAKQRLEEYPLNLPEAQIERILAEGNPASHIAECAMSDDIDLIMMGSHGYGRLHGVLIGSVTAKVIHDVKCPVWTDSTLHSGFPHHIRTILCAADVADETVPLLRFTNELANEFGAKARLVHSVPELQTRPNKYFDFDLHRYLMESARVEISKLQREAGTQFPVCIEGTAIHEAVAEMAETWDANLVVIGRGKAKGAIGQLRTHLCEVIRRSPCPVLSYSVQEGDHISSFCSAAHLDQYATAGQLLTGCRMF